MHLSALPMPPPPLLPPPQPWSPSVPPSMPHLPSRADLFMAQLHEEQARRERQLVLAAAPAENAEAKAEAAEIFAQIRAAAVREAEAAHQSSMHAAAQEQRLLAQQHAALATAQPPPPPGPPPPVPMPALMPVEDGAPRSTARPSVDAAAGDEAAAGGEAAEVVEASGSHTAAGLECEWEGSFDEQYDEEWRMELTVAEAEVEQQPPPQRQPPPQGAAAGGEGGEAEGKEVEIVGVRTRTDRVPPGEEINLTGDEDMAVEDSAVEAKQSSPAPLEAGVASGAAKADATRHVEGWAEWSARIAEEDDEEEGEVDEDKEEVEEGEDEKEEEEEEERQEAFGAESGDKECVAAEGQAVAAGASADASGEQAEATVATSSSHAPAATSARCPLPCTPAGSSAVDTGGSEWTCARCGFLNEDGEALACVACD